MNIHIKIDEDKETGKTPVVTTSTSSSGTDVQDSGASKAVTGDSLVASADLKDIGAPPKWLADAINQNEEMQQTSTTSNTSGLTENKEGDGGNAPSFN